MEAQIAALQQSKESGMDVFAYDSGQLVTVSVAMCDLVSPGKNNTVIREIETETETETETDTRRQRHT